MRKWLLSGLALVLMLALCGCEGAFDQDYLSLAPHDEQFSLDEDSDALTAENYLGLKNAILSFVEHHTDYGVIRIYHYDGEVESDLADAAYEVAKSDPLGAYAVDYMTHDCTLIVSYYEIHIYITYARTQEEIDAVVRVNSISALREAVEQALRSGAQACTLRVSSYYEQDFAALLYSCYQDDPRDFVELPEIVVELYPSAGVQRIVHLQFRYAAGAAERTAGRAALEQELARLTDGLMSIPGDARRFALLTERLLETLGGAEIDESAILYDTLCCGKVNAESLALTLRILCEETGLSCRTVEGRRNNVAYTWNIVSIGGEYYHVDLLRDQSAGASRVQLYGNREMELEYSWDQNLYPACGAQGDEAPAPSVQTQPVEPEEPAAPESPAPLQPEPSDAPEEAPDT